MFRYQSIVGGIEYRRFVAVNINSDKYFGPRSTICAQRKTIEVAPIEQGVVLADIVLACFTFGLIHLNAVRQKMLPLLKELRCRNKMGGAVHFGIAGASQPSDYLLIETFDVDVSAPKQEVTLYVSYDIFN